MAWQGSYHTILLRVWAFVKRDEKRARVIFEILSAVSSDFLWDVCARDTGMDKEERSRTGVSSASPPPLLFLPPNVFGNHDASGT